MAQIEVVNLNKHSLKHVPVVHADGTVDEVSVGPRGKAALAAGMKVADSFSDKDIVVREKAQPKKQELVTEVPAPAPIASPAAE